MTKGNSLSSRVTMSEWRACAESGMTYAEAAEATGGSIDAARVAAHKGGLQFKLLRKRNLTPDQWREVVDSNPDATAHDLVRITGFGKTTIYKAMVEIGVILPNRWTDTGKSAPAEPAAEPTIKHLPPERPRSPRFLPTPTTQVRRAAIARAREARPFGGLA